VLDSLEATIPGFDNHEGAIDGPDRDMTAPAEPLESRGGLVHDLIGRASGTTSKILG
jgi:hypothetical protein